MKKQLVAIALLLFSSLNVSAMTFLEGSYTLTFGTVGGPADFLTFSHPGFPNVFPPQTPNPPPFFWSASYSIIRLQTDGSTIRLNDSSSLSLSPTGGIDRPFTYPTFLPAILSLDGTYGLNILVSGGTVFPPYTSPGYQFSLTVNVPESLSAINTTPIPGALPLFATGLGALGLMTWRRKRMNAALLQPAQNV